MARFRAITNRQARREAAAAEKPEVPYRDLQEQAKEAGIPANQSREELEKALSDE